jgi:hypothetical protein
MPPLLAQLTFSSMLASMCSRVSMCLTACFISSLTQVTSLCFVCLLFRFFYHSALQWFPEFGYYP